MYRVTEYSGDVQIPGQLFWNERFVDPLAADFVAKRVYDERVSRLVNDDYYVLVETVTDDGLGDTLAAYTSTGRLMGDTMEGFIAKFE